MEIQLVMRLERDGGLGCGRGGGCLGAPIAVAAEFVGEEK